MLIMRIAVEKRRGKWVWREKAELFEWKIEEKGERDIKQTNRKK
jgi:hypothetical protein